MNNAPYVECVRRRSLFPSISREGNVYQRDQRAEKIPLAIVTAEGLKCGELCHCFHTLSVDVLSQCLCHINNGFHDGMVDA